MTRRSRLWRAVTVILLGILAIPAAAGAQSLEDAEHQVDQLAEELSAATAAYEDVWARVEATKAELAQLETRAAELEAEAAAADEALAERTRSLYMFGGDPLLASLLSADGAQGAIERASLMSALNGRDRARMEQAVNLRVQLDQTQALAEDKADELAALQAELEDHKAVLEGRLESAKAVASDLRARAARQREITRGAQQGTYACVFERGTSSFRDTWGAPRSGGRRHKGVDIMSWYGNPVYAFTHGRIARMNTSRLGGIQIYLWGDDGNEYFYAHLSEYADGLHVGKRVEAGELVAYNGDSGNARGGAPHVHFEVHPGGGAPENPYPWVAAACL